MDILLNSDPFYPKMAEPGKEGSTIKISHGLTAEIVVRSIFDLFDEVHQHLVTPLTYIIPPSQNILAQHNPPFYGYLDLVLMIMSFLTGKAQQLGDDLSAKRSGWG